MMLSANSDNNTGKKQTEVREGERGGNRNRNRNREGQEQAGGESTLRPD